MGDNAPNQGPIFRTFFSGENFWENFWENFPPKMLGKNGIFHGKSLSAEKNVRKIAQSGYPGAEKTGVK
jgi:hypothetical protein